MGLALSAGAVPGHAPPLDLTTGTVYRVGTVAQLTAAVNAANAAGVPATILVSNGTYVLDVPMLHLTCDRLIVRGVSGDRDAVILRGPDEGTSATLQHVFLIPASHVTIADLTFGWCLYHGIQIQGETPNDAAGLRVHNCRIVNCNEQFIKGSSSPADPVGATDGIVEGCLFEFTSGWAYQYYTGGIDIHKGVNWGVRDNLFRNIRTPAGGDSLAEHAIHFWNRCPTLPQNVVVERNWIINCDRGIGFGLGSAGGGHNGGASVIRNNFVCNDGTGPFTDVGIGLEYASDVRVDNNTVHVPYWAPIEYRFAGSSNLVFRNNLANGAITARDGAPAPVRSNNVQNAQAAWYRNASAGDLHLLPGAAAAIGQGVPVSGFADDIDGEGRPAGPQWDVGADEYDPDTADSDGDRMFDAWETRYGLNPTNAADAHAHADADGADNVSEFIAGTDPTSSASVFRCAGAVVSAPPDSARIVTWSAVSGRIYGVDASSALPAGFVPLASGLSAPTAAYTDSVARPLPVFYRLRVTQP